jgi:hypothetical protein
MYMTKHRVTIAQIDLGDLYGRGHPGTFVNVVEPLVGSKRKPVHLGAHARKPEREPRALEPGMSRDQDAAPCIKLS